MNAIGFVCNICNHFFEMHQKEAFFTDVRGHYMNPQNEYHQPFKCKAPNCDYTALRLDIFKNHVNNSHPNGYVFNNDYENVDGNQNVEDAEAEPQNELDFNDAAEPHNDQDFNDAEEDEPNLDDLDYLEEVNDPNREIHEEILCEQFFLNKFLEMFSRKDTSMQVAMDHIDIIKEILHSAKSDILHKESNKVVIPYNGEDIKLTLFPLENSIKNFLQLPNVLNMILENQRYLREKSLNDNSLYNVINGPLWEEVLNQHADNDVVIPIFLYYDDFNPDNGFGPHKANTELASFYISFPTLPYHVKDNIDHIFIAMMTKSYFVKKYTNIVLLRLVNQMRQLEEGIFVDIGNGPQLIYFVVILTVGDNMALNCIEGFPRTLTSNGFCRVCTMNHVDWSVAIEEHPNFLRNEENYILGQHGIRQNSLLNDLLHHKVYKNQTVDITHDWKLGIYKDDLFFIINYLLDDYDLRVINKAIKDFKYETKDKQYLLPEITEKNIEKRSIPGYAREIWNTINYLPFILIQFIDYENPIYKFALLMVDILDELLRPNTDVDYSRNLEELIKQHNRCIINLFNTDLKPKNHITTHYGRICLKVGPLRNLWTLPFERKHQIVKNYLVNEKNRINTTYSVSRKIAYEEAAFFYNRTNIFQNIRSHSKIINGEPFYGNINLPDSIMVNKVIFKGTDYVVGDYIFSNDKLSINIIREIIISLRNDAAYVVTERFKIIYVNELRSYQLGDSLQQLQTNNILEFHYPPINSHLFRGRYYFRFKYF